MHYEQYGQLVLQIKELEAKKEALIQVILDDMHQKGVDKEECSIGKFVISKLKTWEYPEYVTKLEETYKAEKAKAQSTGDAKFVEKESLRFVPINL